MTVRYPKHTPYTVNVADCGPSWRLPVRGRASWTKAQAAQSRERGPTCLMQGLGVTRLPANHWPQTPADIASEKEWKALGFDDTKWWAYAKLGNHSSFPSTYDSDGGKKDAGSKKAASTTKATDKRAGAKKSTKEVEKGKGKGSPGNYSTFSVRPCDRHVTCGSR